MGGLGADWRLKAGGCWAWGVVAAEMTAREVRRGRRRVVFMMGRRWRLEFGWGVWWGEMRSM